MFIKFLPIIILLSFKNSLMKFYKFCLVLILFLWANFMHSQEQQFINHIQKAEIASFYSSSYLNGYYELELACDYLDSAESDLSLIQDSILVDKYLFRLNSLKDELAVAKDIAADNLNYIYPHYSLISGYRNDFNLIDAPDELLVEDVMLNILEQADPFFKGNLIDNSHFILVHVAPFDLSMLGVCNDFLAAETKHYAIKPHEVSGILGEEGYVRYEENKMIKSDWNKIFEFYSIDKIYNFSVADKGSIIDNLYYKGASLNVINRNELVPVTVKYSEAFKMDKSESFSDSLYILIASYIVFFLLIIIGFEDSFEKIKARFTLENIQADFIILVFVIVSIQLSNYLLSLLDPGINAFIGDPLSKAWIFLNVFLPIGISFVLSFLFTTKFSKSVTTDKRFRSKFIFAAISAPILSDIFYMNYAKFIFDFNLDFIALPFIVLLLLPSRLIGNLWYKYANKGEISRWYVLSVILLIVNYYYSMVFFEEHSSNFYIALLMWIPLTGISFMASRSKNNADSTIDEEQLNSLTNPIQYIREGLNIDSMEKQITSFIDSDIDILSVVEGGSGIGKTRFFREFKMNNPNYEVFIGDFDEFKEGVIQLYEPFFQAFCLHDNANYQIEKGFFSDRSVTFNSLQKVASMASKAGPIDLGEIISIDDNDGLSVNEISGELIELLVDRAKINKDDDKKFVLILDDYQWVDSATNELLLNFIEKIKNRGALSRKFKIILSVSDFELNLKNSDLIFNDSFKKLEDLIGVENIRHCELKATESIEFLTRMFADNGYAYFSGDSDSAENRNVVFSPNLKAHLSEVVKSNAERFKPGNLFNYFQALKNFELLGIEGNLFRLIREPGEDFTFEDSEQILMKSKFDALSDEYKKLIESASHIGFKFDASIVAHIWKLDLIHVINILENIEALGLVEDDPSLDNVFVFTNKNFHKWLRSNHSKESSNEFRQKIIEFQKRIINSVLSKGDEYINNLDIDILKSISNRCNLFLNIDEIEKSALKFNLLTASKLTSLNKLSQASEYLEKAAHSFKYLNESQIESLFDIVENYQQIDKTLNQLEILIKKDKQKDLVLLDEIFDVLLKRTDVKLRSKLVLIFLLDSYRNKREIDLIEKENEKSVIQESKLQRFTKVYDILPFIVDKDRLRGDFYKTLISNPSDIVTLSALKKSAITSSEFNLASEISRHLALCLKSKETSDQMFIHVVDSLYIEAGRQDDIKLLDYTSIDANHIIQIVKNLLSNTSISFQKASDLSYTISRIIEVLFFREDYNNLIKVAKLGESLNKRIGDNFGLYIIWSYSGASNLLLGNIDQAEENYKNHFYTLIKSGSDKKWFTAPLEGILYCCQKRNDYSLFERLKVEMYEHLLFINNDMKESELKDSLIKKEVKLKELIPQSANKNESNDSKEAYQMSEIVFKILYSISLSDGDVDKSELHDIRESVNAITYSMGLKVVMNKLDLEALKPEIDGIQLSELPSYFAKLCQSLKGKYDENRLRSIYYFCKDIALADGVITDSEKELLDIAKVNLYQSN